MQYGELIETCIDAFKQYNPNIKLPDSFLEEYLSQVYFK